MGDYVDSFNGDPYDDACDEYGEIPDADWLSEQDLADAAELYADQGPPTTAKDRAELAEFTRKRDLSGNIIDGAYADGKTKISSVSRQADEALAGLKRIAEVVAAEQIRRDRNRIAAGMVRTLIKELKL